MSKPFLSAVVMGATGAVGTEVVRSLLGSKTVEKVSTVGRRKIADAPLSSYSQLQQYNVDVFDVSSYESLLAGHQAAICTLGVGQPSKMDAKEVHRIDVECVVQFAAACKRQGVRHFSLMTAVDANISSKIKYIRNKGEVEKLVKEIGFERTSFFRPSLLVTPENRYDWKQGLILKSFPKIDGLLIGSLKRYRSIRVSELGMAIARNAEKEGRGTEILQWPEFMALLNK